MKNITATLWQHDRWMILINFFVLTMALGLVVAMAPVDGHAAGPKSQASKMASGAQAAHADMQAGAFDTSAVPQKQKPEWAGIQNKLSKEYTACTDDCGDNLECQEKCWNVYEYRLDREHKRIMHNARK
ncbi:hypothetical protein DESC_600074 [Desulfosarcina cetonica]|uniref:hypothetical protein n=1 Tax=Desulfosarcina cetonica TaxID=90730 RepID=UPI0006D057E4|nr:hypothetical protein [Desulfosarcina cetonica]VTR67360.1 hypothetical protein DESC_600074 [Desulfosarcina cetonica]